MRFATLRLLAVSAFYLSERPSQICLVLERERHRSAAKQLRRRLGLLGAKQRSAHRSTE